MECSNTKAALRKGAALTAALLVQFFLVGGAAGQIHYRGAGVSGCGLWVEARQSDGIAGHFSGLQHMESWLLGYLSAVAYKSGKDFLKDVDAKTIFQWMDGYCKTNALSKAVGHGAEVLAEELERGFSRRP
jgi:hypothetical protein